MFLCVCDKILFLFKAKTRKNEEGLFKFFCNVIGHGLENLKHKFFDYT